MLAGTVVYVNAGTQLAAIQSPGDILSPGLLGSFVLLGLFPLLAKAGVGWLQRRKVYARWTKPRVFDRNLVVIGAGAGGLVSAYIAAAVKAKVTLIEGHKMGGDCLNFGCVPSKALIRSAKMARQLTKAHELGLADAAGRVDFAAVMQRVHRRHPRHRAARLGRALHQPGRAGAAGPCPHHQPLDRGGDAGRRHGADADHQGTSSSPPAPARSCRRSRG
jgi:hypothetical protein